MLLNGHRGESMMYEVQEWLQSRLSFLQVTEGTCLLNPYARLSQCTLAPGAHATLQLYFCSGTGAINALGKTEKGKQQ